MGTMITIAFVSLCVLLGVELSIDQVETGSAMTKPILLTWVREFRPMRGLPTRANDIDDESKDDIANESKNVSLRDCLILIAAIA